MDAHHMRENPAPARSRDAADGALSLRPLLLNTRQVALVLSMSERNVRALVSSGQFPRPNKVGRLSLWRVADLEQWVCSLCGK
jgi:predicted DNA-binding transcriptional regulator AlpA